jgi:serine/threonine-protein kinase
MPYTPGDTLQKRLDDRGPLHLTEILRIGMQIAAGLAAAHAQGLVHRDIKPGNILLDSGVERVTITDFGLARAADDASLTRSGVIAGTPQYMSPEQARGNPLDGRSDLFSLGSVLYAMCTGRPPFRAETALAVLRRICDERPRPIRDLNTEIPDWLEEIVGKLHAKQPSERFQSAREVAELLKQCLAHVQHPTAVPPPPRLSRPSATGQWLPRRLIALVSIAALLGAVLITTAFLRHDSSSQPQPSARPPALPRPPSATVQYAADDERAWQDNLEQSHAILNRLEQAWQTSHTQSDDSWTSEIGEMQQKLNELEENENNFP